MKVAPGELVFIDDAEENIHAAAEAGLQTIIFTSNGELILQLQKLVD